jgi:hypothetical protein
VSSRPFDLALVFIVGIAVGVFGSVLFFDSGKDNRADPTEARTNPSLELADRPGDIRFYRASRHLETRPTRSLPPDAVRVAVWSFSRGMPEAWTVVQDARTSESDGGLRLITSPRRYGYQLISPELTLDPGSYQALARVTVRTGGLQLAVLAVDDQRFLNSSLLSAFRTRARPVVAATKITIDTPKRIQLILANWAPRTAHSEWVLERVRLVETP